LQKPKISNKGRNPYTKKYSFSDSSSDEDNEQVSQLKKILQPPPVAPPGFDGEYLHSEIAETEKEQFEE